MNSFINILKSASRYIILVTSLLLFLASCNTRKFLKDDELLLHQNTIKLSSEGPIKKKRSIQYELKTLYKQKPNTKSFLITRSNLWWHYKTDSLSKPNKFQKWIKRRIAEPPAIYRDDIAEETAQTMQYYLQNKGYYNAEVSYEKKINEKKKRVSVTYIITPHKLYTIDSVNFFSQDPNIQRILNDSEEDSFLKKGEPVSESNYNKEVNRITSTLKNLGYAYFDRNYIDNLTGDSIGSKVNLNLTILNPRNKDGHQVYRIGKVVINPVYYPSKFQSPKRDTLIDGFHYLINEEGTAVNPKSINREIYLREGDLYQEENFRKTNTQLGRLAIYKFISIKPSIDSLNPGVINFEIRLTPKKKMVIGGDLELNNSNYTSQDFNSSLIGIAVNLNFQDRNFRKNASVLDLKASNGIELNIAEPSDPIFSLDILTQADWQIPNFEEFAKMHSFGQWIGLLNKSYMQDLREKGRTRLSASYNRLLLFQFYNYHSLNASFGYDVQRNPNKRITYNQIGINYLLPRFEPEYLIILRDNIFIQNSFTRQLFTGFILRDLKYIYTSKSNIFGNSWKFIGDFELSGLEVYGANKIYNKIKGSDSEFFLGDTVRFSQYVRLNLDYRRYFTMGKKLTLAGKVSFGIARPFGFTETVPYVKQFYGGGPFGNRAWRIRELGPGGFYDPVINDPNSNQIFYQTGDLKLDANIELRFDVFGGLKSAIFVDVGNVWTVEKDTTRPGSQFRFTQDPDDPAARPFYKQLAWGAGIGFRYDFSYFVLGVDLGVKAYTPYIDPRTGERNLMKRWNKLQFRDVNPNIQVGFPF